MSRNQNHNPEPVGAHAVGPRSRRRPWWLWLLLALAALILLFLLLSRCNTETPQPGPGTTTSLASAPTAGLEPSSATPTPTEPSPPVESSPAGNGPSDTAAATPTDGTDAGRDSALTVSGDPLLPLAKPGSSDALNTYVGKPVKATGVTVQAVDADEGFWVGESPTDRVWVQLVGKGGESSYQVKAGDQLTFTGKLVENPSSFAEKVGVSAKEGAAQLTQQGTHIEVDKTKLTQN